LEATNQLMTSAEAQRILHISPTKLAQLRAEGLPFVRLGERTYRYDIAQVRAWLTTRGQTSVDAVMTGGAR